MVGNNLKNIFEKKNKTKLKAVYDNDLELLLKNLEIFSKFKAGEIKCTFCKDVMTFENLHSLFPDSGAIKMTCSKPDCIKLLMTRIEEKQYGSSIS